MESHGLERSGHISRRDSHDLVMSMAKFGNHFGHGRPRTDADVKRAFSRQGIDYYSVVADCRDYHKRVPLFEEPNRKHFPCGRGKSIQSGPRDR